MDLRWPVVDPSLHPSSGDAVRDERVLLVTDVPTPTTSLTSRIAIMTLDDGKVRMLGEAQGAWSRGTAMPHPYVRVEWSDHDPHVVPGFAVEGCTTVVDVRDETISTRGCDPGGKHPF